MQRTLRVESSQLNGGRLQGATAAVDFTSVKRLCARLYIGSFRFQDFEILWDSSHMPEGYFYTQ